MGIGIATALSFGASALSANKQQKAQDDAASEQERLAEEARVNEQQLLAENSRQAQQQATVRFGAQGGDDKIGSFDDFLTPTKKVKASSKTAGLGFS